MPRSYQHIKQHKEEIWQLKEEGLSHREIGERLGYSKIQPGNAVKTSNCLSTATFFVFLVTYEAQNL